MTKEELKQASEEYVIKKHNIDITKQPVDFSIRCEFAEDFTDFQKGAEVGYSNANEWHYPAKGELPEDGRLCVAKFGDDDYGVCEVNDGRFWDKDYGWLEFEDATAWRYIEPPKEEE